MATITALCWSFSICSWTLTGWIDKGSNQLWSLQYSEIERNFFTCQIFADIEISINRARCWLVSKWQFRSVELVLSWYQNDKTKTFVYCSKLDSFLIWTWILVLNYKIHSRLMKKTINGLHFITVCQLKNMGLGLANIFFVSEINYDWSLFGFRLNLR